MRGMPLTVKAFRGKSPGTYVNISGRNYSVDSDGNAFQHDLSDDSLGGDDSSLHIQVSILDVIQLVWKQNILICLKLYENSFIMVV